MRDFIIRHAVEEIRALQGYYAAYSGNSLRKFQDNRTFLSLRVKKFGFLDP